MTKNHDTDSNNPKFVFKWRMPTTCTFKLEIISTVIYKIDADIQGYREYVVRNITTKIKKKTSYMVLLYRGWLTKQPFITLSVRWIVIIFMQNVTPDDSFTCRSCCPFNCLIGAMLTVQLTAYPFKKSQQLGANRKIFVKLRCSAESDQYKLTTGNE